ncbi:MAG TPA: TonB-dependent receptor [Chryseolinea sp.]|nr:TonB-dependent receptor [Chryseolinea sp.]
MKRSGILLVLVFSACILRVAQAQEDDTTRVLNEVVIRAFLYNRPANEVPAAVATLDQKDLERFNNTSILPAVNLIPGVRMEERSPGSYRFSIRGSLLRSPFGVRNVKMYWNGLPLTDGGGNTYLNLLDFNSITSSEIIKGPGGSLYGAGTGGVVLFNKEPSNPGLKLSTVFGSYGLQRYQLSGQVGRDKIKASIQYGHQQSDGYRQQTKMDRDALNADVIFLVGPKSSLNATVFYTDLFYETPGGLTKAQFEADPSQARPAGGPFPSAVDAKAAVRNKTVYGGLMYEYQWSDNWITKAGVYGSHTDFKNPTIRNYEIRDEKNLGGRTDTQFSFDQDTWKGKITFGGEYQYFFSPLDVYNNNGGEPGTVQTMDELKSRQLLLFLQADIDLPKGFYLTLGGSANFLKYDFATVSVSPVTEQHRKFDPEFSPRIALLKKLNNAISVYGSVSKGFSPPSLAEVRPSAGTYNNSLNPERGISYELGLRGGFWKQQLLFDVSTYDFELDETIVIQRTPDGAEYFVNAGNTSQKGVEARVTWTPTMNSSFLSGLKIWTSYTYNHYRFEEYIQDGNDYSGNRLTGVAPTIALLGIDMTLQKVYLNVTTNYTDAIPLNDANTEYADYYFLLGGRVGYRTNLKNVLPFEIFAGIDNALDETYSLGNDLNAIGGRFYNAAAPRNYYFGLNFGFLPRKKGTP